LRLLIPEKDTEKIIEQLHTSRYNGHLGMKKTIEKAEKRFFWFNLREQIMKFIRECTSCQKVKSIKQITRAPLQPILTSRPLELVAMDITGPLPKTKNNKRYILVLVDHFTKFVKAYAIEDQTAETVAKCVIDFICNLGIMQQLLTDQGTDFESELISELMDLLDVHKLRTTPFRPETDGITEKMNRTIKEMLTHYLDEYLNDWDDHLQPLIFAYNTAEHRMTSYSPFELLYGRQPKIPIDLFYKALQTNETTNENINMDIETKTNSYANQMKLDFDRVYSIVKQNNQIRMSKAKIYYDRKIRGAQFNVGDAVLIYNPKPKHTKLQRKWDGPYVVKARNNLDYIVQSTHTKRLKTENIHQNRLKKWHGKTDQTAKFKTAKHRERKSNKEILNTQTSTQQESQQEK